MDSMTALESELERLVDIHGLPEVINSLQGVCGLKAAHIRENWQDEGLARAGEAIANLLGKAWKLAASYKGGDRGLAAERHTGV